MEGIVRGVTTALGDINAITSSLRDVLVPKQGEKPPLKKIMDQIGSATASFKEMANDLKKILGDSEPKIVSLMSNLELVSENLLEQSSLENEGSLVGDVKEILGNVKRMTSDLKVLVADVKAGRGTAGQFLVEDEIADQVKGTLSGVKKFVGRADQLRTELEIYTGSNSDSGSKSSVNFNIFPSPERFYGLGLVTSEFGPEEEKHFFKTVNGVTEEEVFRERKKGSFLLNLQLGRRVQNWVYRIGLIDSSGGVAVDYELPHWNSKFAMELFDYRKDIGPNLRLTTEFHLYSVFRGRVAVEDAMEDDTRSASFGIGLKFTDEDLKGFLSFFL